MTLPANGSAQLAGEDLAGTDFSSTEQTQKRVFVTGASGFVGGALVRRLAASGAAKLTLALRVPGMPCPPGATPFQFADLDGSTDWNPGLRGVDVVVHAAARVHVMHDSATDPLTEFRRVNVDGTLNLARQAAANKVRRFIFVSSIKVNGECTDCGKPFSAGDVPAPCDPYGLSKLEAEQKLRELSAASGMEVVILRPPLVYGPGVKANFLTMMQWLQRGVPLPLGAIHNRRSLVALDNLVDLIACCIEHPAAANQIFLVSDGEDLSTTELLRRLGMAMGCPAHLLPVPARLLEAGARLLGRHALAQRLCGSLQVDIAKTRSLLGWSPPVSVDEALRRTAADFLRRNTK